MHMRLHNRRPASERRFWKRHIVTFLFIVFIAAACSVFLAYSNWRQQTDARLAQERQIEESKRIDKSVKAALQKRIDDAKIAEQRAKEKAEKESAVVNHAPVSQTTAALCDVTNPSSITVVINKKHCFSPKNWAPSNLVSVDGFLLQNEAGQQLTAMMQAATNAGVGFSLSSGYRSYENQVITYDTWVRVNGSIAAADTVSARPGYSEHQTGLAADLKSGNCVLECFGGTTNYAWLQQHAAEYGFIERYPVGLTAITGYSPESWHWRYVGISVAQDMKTKGIQTLESYFTVSGGDY